ncbi:MAG: hypothetical protein GX053_03145 [Tissierella sp.]|nr:hypothetical protein [Tissierella sp.]
MTSIIFSVIIVENQNLIKNPHPSGWGRGAVSISNHMEDGIPRSMEKGAIAEALETKI